jgi:hypothetical protein
MTRTALSRYSSESESPVEGTVPNINDDFERTIAAIRAIQLVRDCYASGPEGAKRVEDILKMLEMGSHEHALRKHIAAAIRRGLTSQPVQT